LSNLARAESHANCKMMLLPGMLKLMLYPGLLNHWWH